MRTLLLLCVCTLGPAALWSQGRSDTITPEDIARAGGKRGSAFDLVQSLRPRWLTRREPSIGIEKTMPGVTMEVGPHVYVEERDMGDIDYLKTIPAELVLEMKYLTATQAGSRYGPTSQPGIVVKLKKLEE